MKCRHCQTRKATRPRGLCWRCYHSPARLLYPVHPHYSAREGVQPALRPRRPSEAPCRCLWCLGWLCERPFRLCVSCQVEYRQRSVGMPE